MSRRDVYRAMREPLTPRRMAASECWHLLQVETCGPLTITLHGFRAATPSGTIQPDDPC